MSEMCHGCAFNKDNPDSAHSEVYNRIRGEVASLTGVPFFCHRNFDYRNVSVYKVGQKLIKIPKGGKGERLRPILCSGWKAAVSKNIPAGSQFRAARRRLHGLGQSALALIVSFVDEKDADLKGFITYRLEKQMIKIRRYGRLLRKATKHV